MLCHTAGDQDSPDAIVPGLLAAGESASASVHGANRLGANSLLDIVVFGRATAKRVAELVKPNSPHKPLPENAGEASIAKLDSVRFSKGHTPTAEARLQLQKVMQANAAVFRTQDTLEEGATLLLACFLCNPAPVC